MYVTRRLSEYQSNRPELKQPASEGPNSGVLVIQDEESRPTCCFGSCYESALKGLPFPQNAKLTMKYTITVIKDLPMVFSDRVIFIPVLDQPLSSNRYYVIKRSGKHSGEASANAKKEDRVPCCFCFTHPSIKSWDRGYFATSVAPGGKPPKFLKRKNWSVEYSTSQDYGLRDDAKGIQAQLRSELTSDLNTNVLVGKWYVPFIFVKEGNVKVQLKSSTYYNMTLHQKWEEVYSCENADKENHEVVVNMEVEPEVVKLEGQGLRSFVTDRMKWEEERFGWKSDSQRAVVKRSDKFDGGGSNWKSYKCYLLVESFVLRRMDETVVLTFEFKHADKLKSKWES
ncbi:hypothetical protein YC2023_104048 [Brassica napus]